MILDHIWSACPVEFSIRTQYPAVDDTSTVTNLVMDNPVGDIGAHVLSSQATLTPSHEMRDAKPIDLDERRPSPVDLDPAVRLGPNNDLAISNDIQTVSFSEELQKFKNNQELDFAEFESNLIAKDTKDTDLDTMEWDELQAEYETNIGPSLAKEAELMERFDKRFQVTSLRVYAVLY